jgi:phage tail-like protein
MALEGFLRIFSSACPRRLGLGASALSLSAGTRRANKVWNLGGGAGSEVSLKDFRKDILIDLHNEAGQLVKSFRLFRCWPSEYSALPELDAAQNSVAIESLVLENEGWERDASVTEPEEPAL